MNSDREITGNRVLDVGRLIDDGPWSGYQRWAVVLTALAVIMDGFDNHLLALAIPSILKEWDSTRSAFALATAVGLIGMALGTTAGGMLADRLGRRRCVIGSLMLFGLVTAANALVQDMTAMTIMRFFAGVGLGGLMPAAASMFAEFTPLRNRTLAVTLGMICVPLGGVLSGGIAAVVLPAFGWRALFVIGGVLAVAIAVFQMLTLPESPRFLARSADKHARLITLMGRMGRSLSPGETFVDRNEGARSKVRLGDLFSRLQLRDTIGLWVAFFAALMCVYAETQWMPTILAGAGYDQRVTSLASSALSFGGMFACIFGVIAVSRWGSRKALLAMCAAAVVTTLGLTQFPLNPASNAAPLIALLALVGFLIGGLQIMIYPVAAHVYPTEQRATGIGWAVGVGRIGSVLSPFASTAAMGAGGWQGFFVLLAAGMGVCLLAVSAIKRHIPPVVK